MTARLPKLSGEQGIGVVVAIATITVTAGLAAALTMIPGALRSRRARLRAARVPIAAAVPARPIRGERAEGHPRH